MIDRARANDNRVSGNQVVGHWWDKNARLGMLDLESGVRLRISEEVIDYDGPDEIRGPGVVAANDFNPSGAFRIVAEDIEALIGKVESHEYKLVRGRM